MYVLMRDCLLPVFVFNVFSLCLTCKWFILDIVLWYGCLTLHKSNCTFISLIMSKYFQTSLTDIYTIMCHHLHQHVSKAINLNHRNGSYYIYKQHRLLCFCTKKKNAITQCIECTRMSKTSIGVVKYPFPSTQPPTSTTSNTEPCPPPWSHFYTSPLSCFNCTT